MPVKRAHPHWRKSFTRVDDLVRRFSTFCALISGAVFLPLAFYMTIDASSRRIGGPFSGISDELASYVLAFGGTWALASALACGAHVRIDIMMHLYPPTMRRFLHAWALLVTALLAVLLATETWMLAYESFEMNARSFSLVGAPLAIPQGLTAAGFSLLAIQAFVMLFGSLIGHSVADTASQDRL